MHVMQDWIEVLKLHRLSELNGGDVRFELAAAICDDGGLRRCNPMSIFYVVPIHKDDHVRERIIGRSEIDTRYECRGGAMRATKTISNRQDFRRRQFTKKADVPEHAPARVNLSNDFDRVGFDRRICPRRS